MAEMKSKNANIEENETAMLELIGDTITANTELRATVDSLTLSNQQILESNRQITESHQQIMETQQQLMESHQQLIQSNRDLQLANVNNERRITKYRKQNIRLRTRLNALTGTQPRLTGGSEAGASTAGDDDDEDSEEDDDDEEEDDESDDDDDNDGKGDGGDPGATGGGGSTGGSASGRTKKSHDRRGDDPKAGSSAQGEPAPMMSKIQELRDKVKKKAIVLVEDVEPLNCYFAYDDEGNLLPPPAMPEYDLEEGEIPPEMTTEDMTKAYGFASGESSNASQSVPPEMHPECNEVDLEEGTSVPTPEYVVNDSGAGIPNIDEEMIREAEEKLKADSTEVPDAVKIRHDKIRERY